MAEKVREDGRDAKDITYKLDRSLADSGLAAIGTIFGILELCCVLQMPFHGDDDEDDADNDKNDCRRRCNSRLV